MPEVMMHARHEHAHTRTAGSRTLIDVRRCAPSNSKTGPKHEFCEPTCERHARYSSLPDHRGPHIHAECTCRWPHASHECTCWIFMPCTGMWTHNTEIESFLRLGIFVKVCLQT